VQAERSIFKRVMGQILRQGGSIAGGAFGGPGGSAIGREIGAGLSRISGFGEYKVSENTIVTDQVPQFRNGGRSVRVSHRDYIGDVTGSIGFAIRSYFINPGLVATFPWLGYVAAQYQEYRIRGIVFEFKSTSATALNNVNTALGTVIMATQYNSAAPTFQNKFEMENYEFSSSCKPSDSMMHPVECARGEAPLECLYVRSSALQPNQDERFYDFGEFQIATVGMQAASVIGELWVTYDIELLKPRLPPGGSIPGQFTRINNTLYDQNATLGITQTTPKGNLGITITATGAGFDTILFPSAITSGKFQVVMAFRGSGAAANFATLPTTTLTNCTLVADWCSGTSSTLVAPSGGTNNSQRLTFVFEVTINGYSAVGSTIQLTAALANFPLTPSFVDIFVVSLPTVDVFV